jgi:hypothetical protein
LRGWLERSLLGSKTMGSVFGWEFVGLGLGEAWVRRREGGRRKKIRARKGGGVWYAGLAFFRLA